MALKEKASWQPAVLGLADGTVLEGNAFGELRTPDDPACGEVVFNTSMFGYQEIVSDPSYAGQIITFTTPHIGNVGCNDEDNESAQVHARGVIVRDLSPWASNFRSEKTFARYLEDAGVMGLCNVDTRELVSHIRDQGAQMGAMACGGKADAARLIDVARSLGSMEGKDYVRTVSCREAYTWNELSWSLEYSGQGKGGHRSLREEQLASRPHLVALDCGIKRNILRLLLESGFRVTVVPATVSADEIMNINPDALFLSNGPGDPATLHYIVKTVQEVVGKFPMFGICLGHQILAQVFGGKTYKLKFGHRGGNHPVMDYSTRKVEITVQNHGFAVAPQSLPGSVAITHVNLNDRTVEGLDAPEYQAFSIQYHPESSPGPHDARYLFKRFFERVVTFQR